MRLMVSSDQALLYSTAALCLQSNPYLFVSKSVTPYRSLRTRCSNYGAADSQAWRVSLIEIAPALLPNFQHWEAPNMHLHCKHWITLFSTCHGRWGKIFTAEAIVISALIIGSLTERAVDWPKALGGGTRGGIR